MELKILTDEQIFHRVNDGIILRKHFTQVDDVIRELEIIKHDIIIQNSGYSNLIDNLIEKLNLGQQK